MKRTLVAFAFAFSLLLAACGYDPVHASTSAERFAVVLAGSNVPDVAASDEVLAGVRDELARRGALAAGGAYPRCEVEVLRSDEQSEGIAAVENGEGRVVPQSRATRAGLVVRAWIVRTKDGPRERDTGDIRSLETVATASDAKTASFRHGDALRAAGRRAGRVVGARVLGLPAAGD